MLEHYRNTHRQLRGAGSKLGFMASLPFPLIFLPFPHLPSLPFYLYTPLPLPFPFIHSFIL